MNIFMAIKSFYFMAFYSTLSRRPYERYLASVVVAHLVSFMAIFLFIFLLFFGKNNKKRFHHEALISHGLSYERWRTVNDVKRIMDNIQIVTKGESSLSLDSYYSYLLFLSFSGLADFRIETLEERASYFFGEIILDERGSYVLHFGERLNGKYRVKTEDALKLSSAKQEYVDLAKEEIYCGKTFSRLVFNGARIVFKRKKLGTRSPKKEAGAINLLGVLTS